MTEYKVRQTESYRVAIKKLRDRKTLGGKRARRPSQGRRSDLHSKQISARLKELEDEYQKEKKEQIENDIIS